jgi:hypothetical protein
MTTSCSKKIARTAYIRPSAIPYSFRASTRSTIQTIDHRYNIYVVMATAPDTAPTFHPTIWGDFFVHHNPETLQVYSVED